MKCLICELEGDIKYKYNTGIDTYRGVSGTIQVLGNPSMEYSCANGCKVTCSGNAAKSFVANFLVDIKADELLRKLNSCVNDEEKLAAIKSVIKEYM